MKESPKEYQTNGPEEDEDIEIPESIEDPLPDYIAKPCSHATEKKKSDTGK